MTQHTPPDFDEINQKLRVANEQGLPATEIVRMLEDGRQEKMLAIIEVMRESGRQNPEVKRIFEAIANPDIDASVVARDVSGFPIAQEVLAALEQGLVESSHSTVVKAYLRRYQAEIDEMLMSAQSDDLH